MKALHREQRSQFNFACDKRVILAVRVLAKELDVPIYPLCEHALQVGMAQIITAIDVEGGKENLFQHIVEQHLLVERSGCADHG
jgi:hypothetical protein